METNNENKALKKFMDNDLVDQLFQRRPEENEREIDTKNFDSIEELYFAYAKEKPKRISSSKGYDLTLIVLDNMRQMVEAMKEMASKPQEINITMPEIKPPIVNVEAPVIHVEPNIVPSTVIPTPVVNIDKAEIPAPIVNIETKPPIITIEASKDTDNVLSAIKSLVDELKNFSKQKPPKFDINVKSELTVPDHEEVIEKVVKRDSLNRIQKTIATKKIIKK